MQQILKSHVYKLAHEIGNRSVFEYHKLIEAEGYITQVFASFGYNIEFQEYRVFNKIVKNIIATKIGADKPQELILVGAHYDTCSTPGADDNASGVAGLLELARVISGTRTNRSVKFVAFVNEEPPFFQTGQMGSRVYAKAAKSRQENIKSAFILESIGYYSAQPHSQQYPPFFNLFYPDRGNFIAIVGNLRSRWLVEKAVSSFKSQTQFPIESLVGFSFIPGVDFSDNWSFWKEGFPAIMITDTAFYRNPDYHGYADTYEKLNYEGFAEVVIGLGKVLIDLASL